MRRTSLQILVALSVLAAAAGWTHLRSAGTGAGTTDAAKAYLATLSEEQKAATGMPFDTPERVGWHFIPKAERKGLQIKHMNEAQRKAAFLLLRNVLSEIGYNKARTIMQLEDLLRELEKDRRGGAIRDAERYYYTVFGQPSETGRWGLSIEGHHLSLNFVVDNGRVVASTPTFFAANPTIVCQPSANGPAPGTRVLANEELLAFNLLQSLNGQHRSVAVIAENAPREIRAAGEAVAPAYAPDGLSVTAMNAQQQQILKSLVAQYANNLPKDVAQQRLKAIDKAGYDKVYFAWAGADRPGIGHYYRIQGPTFLIEFVNTQPDAAGNPASHIHSVWRDPTGDFGIPRR
jgi:hypothetical protein